jgi:hypothetical protein
VRASSVRVHRLWALSVGDVLLLLQTLGKRHAQAERLYTKQQSENVANLDEKMKDVVLETEYDSN